MKKSTVAGVALIIGAGAVFGYQTVQLRAIRAESKELRDESRRRDQRAEQFRTHQAQVAREQTARLDSLRGALERSEAARLEREASTDAALDALYEKVPESVRPYVGAVEMQMVLEREAHEREKQVLRDQRDSEHALYVATQVSLDAMVDAWESRGELNEKIERELAAERGTRIPIIDMKLRDAAKAAAFVGVVLIVR